MLIQLPQPDYDLLRVAVLCVSQFDSRFASEFWNASPAAVRTRLARLEKRKLLESRQVLAALPPSVDEPLCRWRPGDPLPHCGRVSYQARCRWKRLPVQVCRVYCATPLARALFGRAPVKSARACQTSHDLGLAATYLTFRRRWPRLTSACWRNESEYAHFRGHGVKVEDAMLADNERVLMLIDFAGQYRPDRVKALVQHAQEHSVAIAIY